MTRGTWSATAALWIVAAGLTGAATSSWAAAPPGEVIINDDHAFPESLTVTHDGTVILGNFTKPVIYRAEPGAATAEPWIHLTAEGEGKVATAGVLADQATHTLWACVMQTVGESQPPMRHTSLKAFDLKTGSPKTSFKLPGDTNFCNDIAIDKHGVVYISDTPNGRVLRLKKGADALEVWLENKDSLTGVDGLTFFKEILYVNNVRSGHVYRVPVKDDKAGELVDIIPSQPLIKPDGMRAAKGHLYVAENGAGRVSELQIDGDKAKVTVVKEGYTTPTGVEPHGKFLWVSDAKFAKMKDADPGQFKAYSIPLPGR